MFMIMARSLLSLSLITYLLLYLKKKFNTALSISNQLLKTQRTYILSLGFLFLNPSLKNPKFDNSFVMR